MDFLKELRHPIYSLTGMVADKMGRRVYAVGGVVRDVFLHRISKDIDIVVIGNGIEMAGEVARAISSKIGVNVYKNFGTAQFTFQNTLVEFVGARRESYQPDSRKPVVEDGTLEDDLRRRDFTINALALSLNHDTRGELIDLFGGVEDIRHRIIRTPLDPNITFSDDPLRMMRAARFAAQLGFTLCDETFRAIQTNAHRIEIISKERIVEEFNKILLSPAPSQGILLLEKSGLLEQFLPELLALKGVDTLDGRSHKDNYAHTLEVVDKIRKMSDNLWLLWTALLHDIAKPATKRYHAQSGWSFHGHEVVGAKMAGRIFKTLKMPAHEPLKYVKKLIFLHLRPIALVEDEITDSAVRRLLFEAGEDIEDLMMLCEADITSKNQKRVSQHLANFAKVRAKLKEIEEKDRLRNWQPPVSGETIMRTFGLSPSREVGIIKSAIREAILDGVIENSPEAATQLMLEEGRKLGLTPIQP